MPGKSPVYIIVALAVFALSGCATLSYYTQAVGGQWSLLQGREPIQDLLERPSTPDLLRERLGRVETIRAFARDHLALPVGETYSGYIDLERDYVVWNVLAAPPDSLALKAWCYPVIGCQNYRGYFERADAQAHAQTLAEQGWDTWAPGVIAYSSLGWFDDPVLNTFAHWPEDRLAGLIFHELSHKRVYIGGDTRFNESYATAVELEGLLRYLRERGQSKSFAAALSRQWMQRDFTDLVMESAAALQDLYQQPGLSKKAVIQRKAELLDTLRARYHERRQTWPYPNAYAQFFDAGLNNARIASVGTYNRWVPAFRQLLKESAGDFARFHNAVETLSALPQAQREAKLRTLEQRWTPGPTSLVGEQEYSGQPLSGPETSGNLLD